MHVVVAAVQCGSAIDIYLHICHIYLQYDVVQIFLCKIINEFVLTSCYTYNLYTGWFFKHVHHLNHLIIDILLKILKPGFTS